MKEIKKVGVLSFAKIQAITGAAMGLLTGAFYALAGVALGTNAEYLGIMAGFGIALLILLPILYGILGFVFGVLGAFIYNLIANLVGGIEVEIE